MIQRPVIELGRYEIQRLQWENIFFNFSNDNYHFSYRLSLFWTNKASERWSGPETHQTSTQLSICGRLWEKRQQRRHQEPNRSWSAVFFRFGIEKSTKVLFIPSSNRCHAVAKPSSVLEVDLQNTDLFCLYLIEMWISQNNWCWKYQLPSDILNDKFYIISFHFAT